MAKATKGSADARAAGEGLSKGDHTTANVRLMPAEATQASAAAPLGEAAAEQPVRGADGRFAPRAAAATSNSRRSTTASIPARSSTAGTTTANASATKTAPAKAAAAVPLDVPV